MRKRIIQADLRLEKGQRSETSGFCIGAGRAHEVLLAEAQRQLMLTKTECGFRYIRFHGLLHDDMGVFRIDDSGQPFYDWQYIDLLFDALLSMDIRPFVEIGFMPSALASGEETIFWWKGNVTLPKSRQQWVDLIEALTRHWEERYGADEVRQWYFEVWNEPNLSGFFAATQADYFSLYADTARAIKKGNPLFRVGGPATAGCAWIPEFITYCHDNGVPLDFITTHTYGVNGFLDEFGKQQTILDSDPDSIVKDVRMVADQVKKSPMPDLKIHFTEWSTSYSPRDPVHDAYHSASWILSKLKRSEEFVASMSYWTFTDIFEEPGPPTGPFHGGFGLMNTQGLRKPAYFAYAYLNRLGPRELECTDPDAWACADDMGFQVLLWNVTPSGVPECNQNYYVRNLPSTPAEDVSLEIAGCVPGCYRLAVNRVGYRKNDIYTAFIGMKANGSLSPAQTKELSAASADQSETYSITIEKSGDHFRFNLEIGENEVAFLDIVREL